MTVDTYHDIQSDIANWIVTQHKRIAINTALLDSKLCAYEVVAVAGKTLAKLLWDTQRYDNVLEVQAGVRRYYEQVVEELLGNSD